jgi:NADPH:quinone reductase-like Zn-dependent oxidoreductase
VVALVEAGRLTVRIAASYPLERAADAHRALGAGMVAGKIVLDVGCASRSFALRRYTQQT